MTLPLYEYGNAVLKGDIVASHRIKQVYKMLLDLLETSNSDWKFNEKRANKPIEFIETFCKQSQGKMGTPIELMLFQKQNFRLFLDLYIKMKELENILKY